MEDNKTKYRLRIQIIIDAVLACIVIFFGCYTAYLHRELRNHVKEITAASMNDGKYQQYYIEREFELLKNKNKALYDSLKSVKNQIKTLEEFTYSKKYSTGIVLAKQPTINKETTVDTTQNQGINNVEEVIILQDSTYNYNSKTDSLSYDLSINSKTEPNWYKLDVEVKDKFTVVNKDYGDGTHSIEIESQNKGTISDVTAWQKPSTRKWYQRFAAGPSVTVGYDPFNKNLAFVVGASVTYDIFGR